jgi:ribosomal protein L32
MPHVLCSSCGFYKGKKVTSTKMERTLKRSHARKAAIEKQKQMHAEMQAQAATQEPKSE